MTVELPYCPVPWCGSGFRHSHDGHRYRPRIKPTIYKACMWVLRYRSTSSPDGRPTWAYAYSRTHAEAVQALIARTRMGFVQGVDR